MSTPPYLGLPPGARRVALSVAAGPLSALEADPPEDVALRGEVICVPGFTGSKEDFLPLLGPLSRAGVRVLSIDQRGQCDSPALPLDTPYTLRGYGEELRELIEQRAEAGVPVHLLGHSFGGYVARKALLMGPALPLASVTLLGTGPGAVPRPAADRVRFFLAVSRVLNPVVGNRALLLDRHPDPAVQAFIRHRIRGNDRRSLRAIARWLLTEPDRVDELAATLRRDGLPCAVLCGADETTWPVPEQRSMAERLGAPFSAIPGGGHSVNVQQPELLVEALLAFWAKYPVSEDEPAV
ncbi:alpha/beta hydrolase [Actinospica sp.]|uniref:alpha/beta fold hydrolase n=1 Tax=Actinospica sp. TaxID=1872142 RepID=UPI002CCD14D1|nr:alpha/beta hydrolase [Actinospica sp.]HWG24328.1 alpha/beta hydrolase [Actinospica sp.]